MIATRKHSRNLDLAHHRCSQCNQFYRPSDGALIARPTGRFTVVEGICARCYMPRFQSETDSRLARQRLNSAILNCSAHKLAAELSAVKMTMEGR